MDVDGGPGGAERRRHRRRPDGRVPAQERDDLALALGQYIMLAMLKHPSRRGGFGRMRPAPRVGQRQRPRTPYRSKPSSVELLRGVVLVHGQPGRRRAPGGADHEVVPRPRPPSRDDADLVDPAAQDVDETDRPPVFVERDRRHVAAPLVVLVELLEPRGLGGVGEAGAVAASRRTPVNRSPRRACATGRASCPPAPGRPARSPTGARITASAKVRSRPNRA